VRTYTGNRTVLDAQRVEILDMMQRYQEEAGSTGRRATATREYSDIVGRVLAFADQESNDLMFSIEALRSIVNAISGLPGRKSIVYLSNGLPMVAGLGLISAVSSTYQDHAILNQIGRYDRTSMFESLVDAANAQDVTFYTLGAAGLEDEGLSTAEYRSAQDPIAAWRGAAVYLDSIRFMADGTGGIAVVNTNDISAGLDRIESSLFTYYSLGYTLNMSGADKVHRIDVELPNHPDYRVRFRKRFVEKSIATRVQDKVLTGLMFDLDSNPMGVTAETGRPGPAAEGRWTVPVQISFELRTVALLPEGDDYVGRVTLFIAARDDLGKRSDLVRQEHEVRVPAADYEAAQRKRFGITTALLMESGSYRVSVGLMDQITRQSSHEVFAVSVGDA
jgi:VWFA-related protein